MGYVGASDYWGRITYDGGDLVGVGLGWNMSLKAVDDYMPLML